MQINNELKNLDTLLVLGGELENRPRSRCAIKTYRNIQSLGKEPPYIICTGAYSGLSKRIPEKTEAESAKEFISKEIPKSEIFCETKSLDTLAAYIYSRSILDKIKAERIGLITEPFHMPIAIWMGGIVLGPGYFLIPINSKGRKKTISSRIIGNFTKLALKIDLAGIKPGDQKAFEGYLKIKYPFAKEPSFSFYKIGVDFIKRRKMGYYGESRN